MARTYTDMVHRSASVRCYLRSLFSVFKWVVVSVLLSSTGTTARCSPKTVNVVFRYDDYSHKSPLELEKRVLRCFQELHIAMTVAVIPMECTGHYAYTTPQQSLPLPTSKVDLLREAILTGAADVAVHGYTHQAAGLPFDIDGKTVNGYSEFAGRPYRDQLSRIGTAKRALESMLDTGVSVFVPPWNNYDCNTVKALEYAGFECLSAYVSRPDIPRSKLKFVPRTAELHDVREAIVHATESPDKNPVVVVMFHAYDFSEVDPVRGAFTVDEFAGLLRELCANNAIRVQSMGEMLRSTQDFGVKRLIENKRFHDREDIKVPFLLNDYGGVYLSLEAIDDLRMIDNRNAISVFGTLVLLTWLVAILSSRLSHVRSYLLQLTLLCSVLLLFVCGLVVLRGFNMGFRLSAAFWTALGGTAGMWHASLCELTGKPRIASTSDEDE